MSTPGLVPRRAAATALLIATIVWAVPNAIWLVDMIRLLVDHPLYTANGYPFFQAMWVLATLLAVVSIVPALMAMRSSRPVYLVMAAAVLAPLVDLIATTTWYVQVLDGSDVATSLRRTYFTSLSGDYGWRSVTAALATWLVVPVFVALIVCLTSGKRTATATPVVAPRATLPDAWYVLAHGASYGPYRWHDLTTYASDGRVAADAMIRRPDGAVVPLRQLLAPQA